MGRGVGSKKRCNERNKRDEISGLKRRSCADGGKVMQVHSHLVDVPFNLCFTVGSIRSGLF